MKKLILLLSLFLSFYALKAQTMEEAKKHLYYQRYFSAADAFQKIVTDKPKEEEAWYGLVKAYLQQDELQKAKETLGKAAATVGDEPFYMVAMGEVLLAENKIQEAAGYFQQALEKTKSKNPEILLAISNAHIDVKGGNAAYALELLQKAIEKDDKNPALLVAQGNAYRKLNNSSEGYKSYRKALDLQPAHAPALYNMGDIFLSQKNREMYLEYFTRAVDADPAYAPALYRLYLYHFNFNPEKAMEYYSKYMANADKGLQNEYDLADLNYLNKNYKAAIEKAKEITTRQGVKTKPRLYKLVGYSHAALNDSAKALQWMHRYFSNETDSNYVAKDFDILAKLYLAQGNNVDSAVIAFAKAAELVQDSAERYPYYKEIVDLYKTQKNFSGEATWASRYYNGNNRATNVDLFNWALAHYRAEEYAKADSVFGLYVQKYPEQSFGYYWQARTNAAWDEGMKEGRAIPHYEKLIEVLQKEEMTESNKRWLLEAYNYRAAYETNTEKDYKEAITYFDKVLELNPEDAEAKKYKTMLEKTVADSSEK